MTTQQEFDAAYWAAQPPAVQALQEIADETARVAQATQLATEGYLIDLDIMGYGYDPWTLMSYLVKNGYTWVPSALQQPLNVPPGYAYPGFPPYAGLQAYPVVGPAGSIRVSDNIADYPPAVAPPPPPPPAPPVTSLVGIALGSGYFSAQASAIVTLTNGQSYTDPNGRGVFTFHISHNPFAPNTVSYWFTQP